MGIDWAFLLLILACVLLVLVEFAACGFVAYTVAWLRTKLHARIKTLEEKIDALEKR